MRTSTVRRSHFLPDGLQVRKILIVCRFQNPDCPQSGDSDAAPTATPTSSWIVACRHRARYGPESQACGTREWQRATRCVIHQRPARMRRPNIGDRGDRSNDFGEHFSRGRGRAWRGCIIVGDVVRGVKQICRIIRDDNHQRRLKLRGNRVHCQCQFLGGERAIKFSK